MFAPALLGVLQKNVEMVEATILFAAVRKKVLLNADQTLVYSNIQLAAMMVKILSSPPNRLCGD